jgi:hypothetical protein
MTNTIRTPKQGRTANSKRIAEAVDNEHWQKFRVGLKGKSTHHKLELLELYWDSEMERISAADLPPIVADLQREDVRIRIDNYIKALCRGGQLEAGMTFDHFNDGCIKNHIKK